MTSRTCPIMRSALAPKILVGEADTGRLYARTVVSVEGKDRDPVELLDELSACSSSCQHYSSCIPTGEGFATGCALEHPTHFRA